MHLLSLNLQRGGVITATCRGAFSAGAAKKMDEIVVARGNAIELYRVNKEGKMLSMVRHPVFAVIRSLMPFRLSGTNKDYLVVGADSGKISLLEYNVEGNAFKTVHSETFGKTGCRRIVPGQYLAADPAGRSIMIAAVEKQKLVYVMNRDTASRLTISSPLEAHKGQAICFGIVGVDVEFDNPTYAAIELDYTEADMDSTGEEAALTEKNLVYYELDLGLNHVTRKWSDPISRTANLLLPVPGGAIGPSGVLVCGENWVAYKNQGHVEVRSPLPRRKDLPPNRGVLITHGAVHKHNRTFFFLLQSELGDLYKVTLEASTEGPGVGDVVIEMFDTVAVGSSMVITKTGHLFVASDFSNHMLFGFEALGGGDNAVRSTRVDDADLGDDSESAAQVAPTFEPGLLKNLKQVDELESLCPITDLLVADLVNEDSQQLYALCGKGPQSSLRILRHGVHVTEIAVSEVPGVPGAIWAVKQRNEDEFVSFMIVSFTNATLVLRVGDEVEEVTDSGFLTTSATLQVQLMADNSLLQVHANGLRAIKPGQPPVEWRTPGKKSIERAATNARQVAITLGGGELIYFELDDMQQQLMEVCQKDLGMEVSCLEIGNVPEGRLRFPFLAMGDWSGRVTLLSLQKDMNLEKLSVQQMRDGKPDSLCFIETMTGDTGTAQLHLHIGLDNGVSQRVAIDPSAGTPSDMRARFLGTRSVKLVKLSLNGASAALALSSRPWLSYTYQGRHMMSPLSYDAFEHASSFSTPGCVEGIVGTCGSTLRIISVDQLGETFNQSSVSLRYTPRQLARLPGEVPRLVLVEADANDMSQKKRAEVLAAIKEKEKAEKKAAAAATKNKRRKQVNGEGAENGVGEDGEDEVDDDEEDEEETNGEGEQNGMDVDENGDSAAAAATGEGGEEEEDEEEDEEFAPMPIRGPLPETESSWSSCIRLLDPIQGDTLECLELEDNEAALSVTPVTFHSRGQEAFVVVGTVKDLTFHPRRAFSQCFIHVYRVLENRLVLLHKTPLPELPLAIKAFQNRLLVGCGTSLRLYDLGMKRLLRKCENKTFPSMIVSLATVADRIFVGDMHESVHFVKYRRAENQLVIFADDMIPRMTTKICALDVDTVAAGDKFGNLFVLRVPEDISDDLDNPSGTRVLWDTGVLNGAPNKVQQMAEFHIGEIVTSLHKASLVPGGDDMLLYSTIMGSIGAFLPFRNAEDLDFFTQLEMYMRQEFESLCGRDHLAYRSYFIPVKGVVDGDLCEQFNKLTRDKQKTIAKGLDRDVEEVVKKLEDMRNKLL